MRVRVIDAPLRELLIPGQHRVDDLIEHVVRRLAEKGRVRVQRLRVLSIEPRDMTDDLFSAGAWFDERHSTPLVMQKRALELRPKGTLLAPRSVRWMSGANPWCKARGDRVPNAWTISTPQPGRERPPDRRWGQDRSAAGGVAHVPAASRHSFPWAAQTAALRRSRLRCLTTTTSSGAASKRLASRSSLLSWRMPFRISFQLRKGGGSSPGVSSPSSSPSLLCHSPQAVTARGAR